MLVPLHTDVIEDALPRETVSPRSAIDDEKSESTVEQSSDEIVGIDRTDGKGDGSSWT
jgi:hypothetical protein